MQNSFVIDATPNQNRFQQTSPFLWQDLRKAETENRDANLDRIVRERTEAQIPSVSACMMCVALAATFLAMFATISLVIASAFGNTNIWELLRSL